MAKRRGNGEGSIFQIKRQRKDGSFQIKWCAEVFIEDSDQHKTRKIKRIYGDSRQDVSNQLKDLLYEQKQQLLIAPTKITVEQHMGNWLKSKRGISETTYALYEQTIKSYINLHIGEIPLQKLEASDVENLFTTLQTKGAVHSNKGLSPSMLKKVRKLLSAALDKAVEESIIRKNLAKKIELPTINKISIKPLTKEELKTLLTAASKTRFYIALLLSLSTGIRRGELLALRWQDIDFKTSIATINRQLVLLKSKPIIKEPKTEKSFRSVGIPKKVLVVLEEHKKQLELNQKYSPTDLIVCQQNNKWYHPREFKTQIDNIFEAAKVEKRRIHDFRHTFATHLLSSGESINNVQEALGHTDPRTTFAIYGHSLPGSQQKIASKMNDIIPI